jgi:Reverse transcriptase (RNA-dependent DNA polymerase).
MFNLILRFGHFPYALKSAKVILILKPGKLLSDPGSHRPTSLLSTVSKFLERVVTHRLNSFIHHNLPPEQFGFHKQHSTVSQLARIANFIIHGFNLIKHTGMVFT